MSRYNFFFHQSPVELLQTPLSVEQMMENHLFQEDMKFLSAIKMQSSPSTEYSINPVVAALIQKHHIRGSNPLNQLLDTVMYQRKMDELIAIVGSGISKNSIERILSKAIWSNQIDVIEMIFEFGVSPDLVYESGDTLFYRAAVMGQDDVLQYLLQRGSHMINTPNQEGKTPIVAAVENQHLSTLKFLLAAGADPTVRYMKGRTIYHEACLVYPNPLNNPNWLQTKIEILQVLFEAGVPGLETAEDSGITPLHWSVVGADVYPTETLEFVRAVLRLIFASPTQGKSVDAVAFWIGSPTDMAIEQLMDNVTSSILKWEMAIIPPELVEIINTFRAVGGQVHRYLFPETGEVDEIQIMNTIQLRVGPHRFLSEVYYFRDQIVTLLRTPLTQDQIAELRYPIFLDSA